MKTENDKIELQRFTTLINPKVLSNIKLISYFTNQKLYEVIDKSLIDFVTDFETKNNTSIQSIINLQTKFSQPISQPISNSDNPTLEDLEKELDVVEEKTKKGK